MSTHRFSRRAALVAAVLLLFATAAWARFSLEQVMSSPFPSQLVAGKNADRVAWVFNFKGVRNVWVADGPNFAARQVTHYSADDGLPIASLRITPDGKTLVYARGTESNDKGEVADPTSSVQPRKQQVWAVDVDKGEPRLLGEMGCPEEDCEDIQISPDGQRAAWAAKKQIWIAPIGGGTAAKELAHVRGDNGEPRWSPDGKQIAFVSDREDHVLIAVYDFGRDTIRYLAPSVDRDTLPRWSPDGRLIVFVRQPGRQDKLPLIPVRPHPWALWVADPATGAGREIWHSTNDEAGSFPWLTANESLHFAAGNRIIFASEQDGWNHLYSIPASGGAPVLLTPGKFEVEDVELSADKKSVLFSSNQDDIDRRHLWRVPVEGGIPQALTRGESIEWAPVETATSHTIVCLGSSATSPAMPYHLSEKGREMLAAEALPKDFPSAELVVPKQVIFESDDGYTIHGQLFVPKDRNAPGPALIFIHGGSVRQMVLGFHYMQYYHNSYAENQYLASLGYLVLSVNYRTGIMYGRAFREAPNTGWRGGNEYRDVVAGAKYLQGVPIVDAKKIGLWGGSYGGYLTAMGLARNSDLFAAGVDLHGVHDWSAFLPRWEKGLPKAPDADAANKLAFESSPNASVEKWKSPVLLVHGDDDRNVPVSQTVDLAQRLRQQHVPFEQLVFPDEIHDFLLWRNWIRAYQATADFFDRSLKRGEKIGEGTLGSQPAK